MVGTDADGRDVWEVAMSSGYRSDGRQRRITRRIHDTERDAAAALGRLAMEMGKSPHAGDSLTLSQYWEWYYLPSLDGLTRATREGYEAAWRNHVAPAFGGRDMSSLSRVEVRRWLLSVRAPSARRNAMKLLRQMLNAAMDDELLDSHPLQRPVRVPQARTERPRLWTAQEVMACVDHMWMDPRMSRFLPPVLLMAGGGLRREEAMAVERRHCAWLSDASGASMCLVSVERAYTPRDGYKETKTAQSTRIAALPDPFASMLDETMPGVGAVCVAALAGRGMEAVRPRRDESRVARNVLSPRRDARPPIHHDQSAQGHPRDAHAARWRGGLRPVELPRSQPDQYRLQALPQPGRRRPHRRGAHPGREP